ncbi:hypothetical protein [Arthrobacter sp. MMS18-M83]|uniref:hypothetical protein n=1 Tax=Arthrobacter sp. MMS18-M83 TaxID=2996261 RepID=UPI00227BC877|nr:hypothetical protein [Arthrobacter sp. MMS18-M83]WAH97777.1 hypothetical protein OW521_02440 [Arthrobacter sp. MMS18-M83]
MISNPVIKPKVATPALILASAVVALCAEYLPGRLAAGWQLDPAYVLGWAAVLSAAVIVGRVWMIRSSRRRTWILEADAKWRHLEDAKRTHGTTAEITVLSVDALEPTGSWITINWNRFGHVQSAWLEALAEPIWAGSVLLISPDPTQIRPGSPWPALYYVRASNFLAWAPIAKLSQDRISDRAVNR